MKSNAPSPLEAALTAVMTAAVAAVTMVISVPFPLTRGYFNFGDAIVMLAGLLFGARLGGFAGGIGSALADVLSGYPYYAPLTLLIKGTEGFLTGLIGNNKRFPVRVIAVCVAAITMLAGYFAVETPLYGMGAALAELLTVNSVQVISGAVTALFMTQIILKAYPAIRFMSPPPNQTKVGIFVVVIAAVILVAIVGTYLIVGISP
jgi:uncharacterized membrane protein